MFYTTKTLNFKYSTFYLKETKIKQQCQLKQTIRIDHSHLTMMVLYPNTVDIKGKYALFQFQALGLTRAVI